MHLADAERERVTLQSLYEAADTAGNRVDGCHKMRYRIVRCNLSKAHLEFDRMRQQPAVHMAVILTALPDCYATVPSRSDDEDYIRSP